MRTLFLLLFPVALILGGMVLGWLARWYRYGGRCGPRGLADGVPNIDAERGTVTLDGTEPVVTAGPRRARAAEDARAALGALRSGYADGKRTGAPGAAIDGSPAARVGALAGNAAAAAASVGSGVAEASASASASLRDAGSEAATSVSTAATVAVDGTKSGLASMREGYVEGKVSGETPDAPADGSVSARVGAVVGGAVASVAGAAASAAESAKSAVEPLRDGTVKGRVTEATSGAVRAVKDTASGTAESTKSGLAAMKEGYAEGKAPVETPGDPADGSVLAKVGAVVGGAVSSVKDTASSVTESAKSAVEPLRDGTVKGRITEATSGAAQTVKDTASGATEGTRSGLAAMKEGYAEGKAPVETPGDPADGSVLAKVGAVVGGAVSSVKDTASSVTESAKSAVEPLRDGTVKGRITEATSGTVQTVKDTASGATESTKSGLAAMKEGYAEGKAPVETPGDPADGSVLAKVGAVVGGAVSSVKDTASSVTESAKSAVEPLRDGTVKGRITEATSGTVQTVKDTASGATEGTKSGLAAMKEGYAEGKAPVETPGDPADGSVLAKVGAVVGGAVASSTAAVSGAVETAKDAVTPESDPVESDSVEDAARRAARHDRGLPGATIGQEDGHTFVAGDPAPGRTDPVGAPDGESMDADTAALRTRFAALADETADDAVPDDRIPAAFDEVEEEARRLIEAGAGVSRPGSALAAPAQGRAPDDLKRIGGVGPKIESALNDEGIYYFDQIAGFTGRDLAWADRTLGFVGRVVRDRWVPQARMLAGEAVEKPVAIPVGHRVEQGASGDAPANTPLHPAEADALRLIEREGGYAATSQNRPALLMRDGPVGGRPDDLTRIKGVGDKLEKVLNGLGIYYFRQIGAFSASDIAWIDSKLKFKGRIIRDRWVPQAVVFEQTRDT